jgi:hypothetical protein
VIPAFALRLYVAQEGLCFHCGYPMLHTRVARANAHSKWDNGWSVEHIVPVSLKGSKSVLVNTVLAHVKCNRSRGNRLFTDHENRRAAVVLELAHSIDEQHPWWPKVLEIRPLPRLPRLLREEKIRRARLTDHARKTSPLPEKRRFEPGVNELRWSQLKGLWEVE